MTAIDDVRVIIVTDEALAERDLLARLDRALAAVKPGSAAIQLRDRKRSGRELLVLAEKIAAMARARGAPLLVNDRLDIARLVGAAGAHLGGRSVDAADAFAFLGAGAAVTMAAHSIDDVQDAARAGASAALVSPIFSVPGKGPARGVDFIQKARHAAPILPLFALGGIDANNAAECVAAGASGVAVIRAVLSASDPAGALAALDREVGKARRASAGVVRGGRAL